MMPASVLTRLLLAGSAAAAMLAACADPRPALPASGWTVEQRVEKWKLEGFEENMDLSGIAAANGQSILLGSDELTAAQAGDVDRANRVIKAGNLIPLLPNPSGKKLEIDIEGVAFSPVDHCYYVTGSHGVGKKNGDFQEAQASIFKIPTDPATGAVQPANIQRTSLIPWLEQSDAFRDYVKKPLQHNGFNVEGLTWHGGKLFFGVRGPNVQGNTFVIETAPESLFGGGLPQCTVHLLPVGETRGIRELTAVRDGFIIVTGNASAEATKKFPTSQTRMADKVFDLFLWRPGKKPVLSSIGVLPRPSGKAEALLVLEDAPGYVDLLVLFDGAPDGGPQCYRLNRP